MTDPIRCSPSMRHESVDAVIHDAVDARADVRLDSTPPQVHRETLLQELTPTAVVKGAEFVAGRALGHAGEAVAAPFGLGFELLHGAASDIRRGDEENQRYHYDMMRGVLAVFETRSGSPDVVRERASNPAFRDGCDRAERIIAQDAELTERLMNAVRTTEIEGYAAVVTGRDHGATFERRYRDDLCFKHAVDHARSHRDSGDARWGEIRERVGGACELARDAVAATPMRI